MPAEAAVEDLPSARAQERKNVLEVRGGACRGAKRRRIERASPRGEKEEAGEAAPDLEATRGDVLVRQAVIARMGLLDPVRGLGSNVNQHTREGSRRRG